MSVRIIKSYGQEVDFDPEKVRRTIIRAGAEESVADRIVNKVSAIVKTGMTTKELFRIIRRELRREDRHIAQRYNLRSGLLRLGPSGFRFEQYVSAVMTAYQYDSQVPPGEMSGLCVDHEIDVMAERDGKTVMIEAKFRNRFDDTVNLKDTMATWSRFNDLIDGAKAGRCPRFDEVWIVTNGRFSDRASDFGGCKGMHLVGWNTQGQSFARMVDHAYLYPVTVLDYLRIHEIEALSRADLMLCSDVAKLEPNSLARRLGLEPKRMQQVIHDCQEIIRQPAPGKPHVTLKKKLKIK